MVGSWSDCTQIVTGTFLGLAVISASLRTGFHIKQRGKLFVDDYLVLLAICCAVIAGSILYYLCPKLYIVETLNANPADFILFSKSELLPLFNLLRWLNSFTGVVWTAYYLIKWSFLAFFRLLIRDVSRGLNWF